MPVHLIRPLDSGTDAKRSASVPPQKSSRRVPTCRAPSAVEVGLGVLRREALESAAQERVCGLSRGKPGSCFAAARDTERLVTLAARPRRLEDALGPSSVTLSPPQGRPQLLTQRWDSLPTLRPPRRAKRARRIAYCNATLAQGKYDTWAPAANRRTRIVNGRSRRLGPFDLRSQCSRCDARVVALLRRPR